MNPLSDKGNRVGAPRVSDVTTVGEWALTSVVEPGRANDRAPDNHYRLGRWLPMPTIVPQSEPANNDPRRTPTSVYRYYDGAGFLIYVGITARGGARNRQHNGEKDWWQYVTRQEVEHFDTRDEAAAREKELIRAFHPPFNTTHNPGWREMRELYEHVTGDDRPPRMSIKDICVQTNRVLPLTPLASQPTAGELLLASHPVHYLVAKRLFLSEHPVICKNANGTSMGRVTAITVEGWSAIVHLRMPKKMKGQFIPLHVVSGALRFRMAANNTAEALSLRIRQEQRSEGGAA